MPIFRITRGTKESLVLGQGLFFSTTRCRKVYFIARKTFKLDIKMNLSFDLIYMNNIMQIVIEMLNV